MFHCHHCFVSEVKCFLFSVPSVPLLSFRGVFQSLVTKHFPSEKQRREKAPGNKRKRKWRGLSCYNTPTCVPLSSIGLVLICFSPLLYITSAQLTCQAFALQTNLTVNRVFECVFTFGCYGCLQILWSFWFTVKHPCSCSLHLFLGLLLNYSNKRDSDVYFFFLIGLLCCGFQSGKPRGRQPKVPKHTVDSGGVINISDDSSSDSEGMDTDSNSSPDSLLDNDDVIFVNHTNCQTGREITFFFSVCSKQEMMCKMCTIISVSLNC